MKTNFPSRDWELLSEYLDQQLHPAKRSKLEMRLQQDAELRAALEELRRTRAILRSAPKIKAPRNFTLKPHMVPQRPQRRVYPVFQFASALASVLFVIVLIGDLLGVGLAPQAPMMMAEPAPAGIYALEEAPEALSLPPEEGPMESAERQIVPPEELPQEPVSPESLVLPTQEASGEYPPPLPGIAAQPFDKELLVEGEQTERVFVPEEMLDADSAAVSESTPPASTWRYLQVSFALLALISGALAIYLKRLGH
jgi:hypothetical protein